MNDYMRQALVQAALVVERVYPYPGVGVVLVSGEQVVARTHNGLPGQPHAEIQAITRAEKDGIDLTTCVLYTNLEPCCNIGLQPSCVKVIVAAGIKEVHIAVMDPYHMVRGAGRRQLEEAGVKVVWGEYEEETRWQLRRYFARFCWHCGWPREDGSPEVSE